MSLCQGRRVCSVFNHKTRRQVRSAGGMRFGLAFFRRWGGYGSTYAQMTRRTPTLFASKPQPSCNRGSVSRLRGSAKPVCACAVHFRTFALRYTARDGIRGRHTVFIFREHAAPKDILCAFAQLAAPRVFLATSFLFKIHGITHRRHHPARCRGPRRGAADPAENRTAPHR